MHSLIAKWVSANQRDWDQLLSAVAFAYHTAVHETTGFMPYFLQDGRKARLPADLRTQRTSSTLLLPPFWTISALHSTARERTLATPFVGVKIDMTYGPGLPAIPWILRVGSHSKTHPSKVPKMAFPL